MRSDRFCRVFLTHSKREIEEEIARRNPKAGHRDRIRPLNAEYDELKVRIKKLVSKNIERTKALNPSLDLSQVVEKMFEYYLDREDSVRKAERAAARKERKDQNGERPAKATAKEPNFGPGRKRTPPTAVQKHTVNLRDRQRCTFICADGKRCESEHWTEVHHIVGVSLGGTNDPSNLTTLCSFHHDLVHQLSLPMDGQFNWLPHTHEARE